MTECQKEGREGERGKKYSQTEMLRTAERTGDDRGRWRRGKVLWGQPQYEEGERETDRERKKQTTGGHFCAICKLRYATTSWNAGNPSEFQENGVSAVGSRL